MKINNAKFALVFAEKTNAACSRAGGASHWDHFLAILEPELKQGGCTTKHGECAWSIDLTRGLHILTAILHHASTGEAKFPVYVLFSKRPIELLSIPAQAGQPANHTQKPAE